MLRIVLDVNVLVSAAIRQSSIPGLVLNSWRAGLFELIVSARLLAELRDVLGRSHLARFVTPADAEELIAALEENATVVEDPPAERVVPGDPDDDYLVALARAGRAHVIVTGDAHLLEADLRPPAVRPQDFLARLEQLPL